jgi:hypothetical protein
LWLTFVRNTYAIATALESISEGYAAELDPAWNIKVTVIHDTRLTGVNYPQITVIQPARFRTAFPWRNVLAPIHPAYSDPTLPSRKYRSIYPGGAEQGSDGCINKFALQMQRLVQLDEPPFYLPLHRTSLEAARNKSRKLLKAVEEHGSWSDDIYIDEENSQAQANRKLL